MLCLLPRHPSRFPPAPCLLLSTVRMNSTPIPKRAVAWTAIAAAVALVLWLLGPALTPFAVAFVLAYALTPLVKRLHRACRERVPLPFVVVVVELFFLVVLAGILLLLVPIFTKELPLVREQLPALLDRFTQWLQPVLNQLGVPVSLKTDNIKAMVLKYLNTNAGDSAASVLSSLRIGGSVALAVVGNAVLVPVALFYLLLDWDRIVAGALKLVPLRMRAPYDSFVAEADMVLGQYLRGQLLVMLLLAAFYSIALSLFGLDLAVPIGIFTGLASCVPYLGFGFGLVLASLAALLQFGLLKAALVVGVTYGMGQVIEGFFLTPMLVGERIGLHPLAVIFALLAFGQLFGFVGVLVALPVSAVLYVAVRRVRAGYLASALYTG